MNNIIKIKIVMEYGLKRVIIVSNHFQSVFQLTKRKTLKQSDIDALKALGFIFEVIQDPIPFNI